LAIIDQITQEAGSLFIDVQSQDQLEQFLEVPLMSVAGTKLAMVAAKLAVSLDGF
jgi:hypothetical protein